MKKNNYSFFVKRLTYTLKSERTNRGYSQEALAQRAGISRQAIGKIEAGERNPTMLTVYKLVKAMDMQLDEFIQLMKVD